DQDCQERSGKHDGAGHREFRAQIAECGLRNKGDAYGHHQALDQKSLMANAEVGVEVLGIERQNEDKDDDGDAGKAVIVEEKNVKIGGKKQRSCNDIAGKGQQNLGNNKSQDSCWDKDSKKSNHERRTSLNSNVSAILCWWWNGILVAVTEVVVRVTYPVSNRLGRGKSAQDCSVVSCSGSARPE